ncbi:McrB family protein [Halopseudomonas pelagia]|uniref:McrB family protein n=1 Tax=Halopseudomonas pelagia TaxID=553151 RepID=UPI0003A09A60|nr:hypothetical protein [Halopseudomonas pelagia]
MTYEAWTKIDSGSEGAWAPDVWLGVIEIISRHEGETVYDQQAPIYEELQERFPSLKWVDKDQDTGVFRPYFRDFSKAWTNTKVASFDTTFRLTPQGRRIAEGSLSAREHLIAVCEHYSENDEYPFRILAEAFLKAGRPLSLAEIFFGIETAYRPGKDQLVETLSLASSTNHPAISGVAERRLNLMLALLERTGGIAKSGTGSKAVWRLWDKDTLSEISKDLSTPGIPAQQEHSITGADKAFVDAAKFANLSFAPSLSLNTVASLLAKPFLILTGLSGSGKTKLAHAFAAWMSSTPEQYRIVAVGADWTSNESVLGYADALQKGQYCKPTSGALDIILRASNDSKRPYFLILDEMNLSHVERYFSDILSAIESQQTIALHSSESDLMSGTGGEGVPPRIKFPQNLYIIGTVNVDETTYMFSPKVLDRSNVIEFRASSADISSFLESPQAVDIHALAGRGAIYSQAFITASSIQKLDLETLDASIAGHSNIKLDLNQRLTEAFNHLAAIGAEFGFRTALEITRFTYFHAQLTGPGWKLNDALDAQILQKLLPKLHGSERRLGPVLDTLSEYCEKYDCQHSLQKIRRMQERLQDGFTSFAEA